MPEFVLDQISAEEFAEAGSKFVDVGIPSGQWPNLVGKSFTFPIECQNLDWDKVGESMKIETVITDGINKGHEEKISFGVTKTGIWKGKTMYKNISQKDMPMKQGHPAPNTDDINGKKAVGLWTIQKGLKGGDPNAGDVYYPKLQDILPVGYKLEAKGQGKDLGI
jgi:hypothetical protein